jgi:hypothetical protein
MKKFVSTMRKGFHITFENGLEASVQWGAGNYCDNHFPKDMDFTFSKDAESNTAEVAVFRGNSFADIDQFLPEGCSSDGTVAGYLTPEQVVDFLMNVKNYKEA